VKLGFLPVPTGYRRSGGGIVRNWNGASGVYLTPGIDAPATLTVLMDQQREKELPEPPTPPEPEPPSPPDPPDPPNVQDVPGALGLGALAALFVISRKLRRRIHS
jgi:MYXO-CTERM domain-containing protein